MGGRLNRLPSSSLLPIRRGTPLPCPAATLANVRQLIARTRLAA
jgi:hypothetical protein